MTTETILSIFLGVSLAASVGFRVFLPLFVLSIASYTGMWELNENWDWLGSLPALITLGVAMILEIGAYFIPWVDTVLDAIAIPLAAIAGTAVMVSTVADLSPMVTWVLAIVAGGGTATAIKRSYHHYAFNINSYYRRASQSCCIYYRNWYSNSNIAGCHSNAYVGSCYSGNYFGVSFPLLS